MLSFRLVDAILKIILLVAIIIRVEGRRHKQVGMVLLLLQLVVVGMRYTVGAAVAGGAVGTGILLWDTATEWSKCVGERDVETGLRNEIVDGKDNQVTFDEFPYYLSAQSRALLKQIGFFHLQPAKWSKDVKNLFPRKHSMLLSGPSEIYMQMLAKALSSSFGAKLLMLDIANFKFKVPCKNSCPNNTSGFTAYFSDVVQIASDWLDIQAPVERSTHWCFSEKTLIESLQRVLVSVSSTSPVVLYIRDVEDLLNRSTRTYYMFRQMLEYLSKRRVVIIGSRLVKPHTENAKPRTANLFPYAAEIEPPKGESSLSVWRSQMKKDAQTIKTQYDRNVLRQILAANNIDCDDLDSVWFPADRDLEAHMKNIVLEAVSNHLSGKDPEYRSGKLIIPSTSLSYAASKMENSLSQRGKKNVVPENTYEKNTSSELIPPNRIDVTFDDIGALDGTKELLQELVMLPLRRPELFKTGLLKPCRGILLFGPPGTGKTMLAKAIAKESGASFISVSSSSITSKWYGEAEKNVKALFTLAAKAAPAIIFVDEVDSMLSQRNHHEESHATRRVKNEFMTHWDGLLTNSEERILVLGATNRPFDLDDAVIRRFERRIMVGLPSKESRELILKKLLSKENVEGIDYQELAALTEGYTGSDLKNVCVTAAYRPVRELLKKETANKMEEMKQNTDPEEKTLTEKPTTPLRPLNMEDLREAKNQVAASFPSESAAMNQMKQWNELYGEGGSRKKREQLTYFL